MTTTILHPPAHISRDNQSRPGAEDAAPLTADGPLSGLGALVRQLRDRGVDQAEAAAEVTNWLLAHPERLVAVVTKFAHGQVRDGFRRVTKIAEGDVIEILAASLGADVARAFRPLKGATISLPDGRVISWLDATADELEERAHNMTRKVEGLRKSRDLLTFAAREIRKAGVETMRDLIEARR